MAKHGLGRGFESLIPTDLVDEEFDPTADVEAEAGQKLREIKITEIIRDEEQPRKDFDAEALQALADSIKEHGILSPIVVVKEEDKYKIVAGERRWRAAKIAGLDAVPAIVRTLDAQNRLELSIIENAQREDLSAIELATAYAKLKTQFNLSEEEIAKRVGKSKTAVENTMRLLNLPDFAKKAMQEHKLSEGVMRPLVAADEEITKKAIPLIVDEGWTVRQVQRFIASKKKRSSAQAVKASTYLKQEEKLGQKYCSKVRIGTKSVTFSVKNEEELKKLLKALA
ncbi:ParB/RepB/Spo0J family partition protein [Candidatus Saccharibacteria bacterium]|nr:ParB/RepB/Spo0J family partition protein [Candidatus Saccharibacteria bacterium]